MLLNHIGNALAGTAMLGKIFGGAAGLLGVDFRLCELLGNSLDEFACAVNLLGNACAQGFLAGSLKVVNRWAKQHGFAALQRFYNVLAACINKAAANENDVGSLKISIHFAHAVANPNLGIGLDGSVVAAFLGFETALLGEVVGSLKTLGVAWDDDEQGICVVPCVKNELGFVLPIFFAQTGGEKDAAVADFLAKLGGKFARCGRDGDVVFGVAADDGVGRAKLSQALGIGWGLCAEQGGLGWGFFDNCVAIFRIGGRWRERVGCGFYGSLKSGLPRFRFP